MDDDAAPWRRVRLYPGRRAVRTSGVHPLISRDEDERSEPDSCIDDLRRCLRRTPAVRGRAGVERVSVLGWTCSTARTTTVPGALRTRSSRPASVHLPWRRSVCIAPTW